MSLTTQATSTRHAGRGHIKALDGIRGIAVLMVLVHHAFVSNFAGGGRLTEALGDVIHFGRIGVDLFFVLSGFLITGILLDTRADPGFFKKFYSRRVLRIFPLYYGVLFLLLALTPVFHFDWQGMRTLLLLDLQNLRPATISNLNISPSIGLFHFWSLAIEEQFYFVWPAAVFFLRDRRSLVALTLTLAALSLILRIVLVATGHSEVAIRDSTLCRADSLLLGGLLAMLSRSSYWPRVLSLAPKVCLATAALLAVSLTTLGDEGTPLPTAPHATLIPYWISGLRFSVFALCFASLIAWSLRPSSVMQSTFERPTLRFFGKYSYGLYLLHVPIITLCIGPLRSLIHTFTQSKVITVAASGFIAIALSILAAILSFNLYEKPFLRLKRFFDYAPALPSLRPSGPAFRDFPPGTVVAPAYSDRLTEVVEAIPQPGVSIR